MDNNIIQGYDDPGLI